MNQYVTRKPWPEHQPSKKLNVFPFKLARKVFRIAAEEKAALIAAEEKAAFQYEPYDSDASMS